MFGPLSQLNHNLGRLHGSEYELLGWLVSGFSASMVIGMRCRCLRGDREVNLRTLLGTMSTTLNPQPLLIVSTCPPPRHLTHPQDEGKMGVVLKVLVKEGPLGEGILTKKGTYILAILGTGILNNYQMLH